MSSYVVLDFEMCPVKKDKRNTFRCKNELIEIGAVLLDENYNVIDSFKTYVRPKYGQVTPFIQKLTGITKADTDNAPNIKEALEDFISWLPEDAILVSWSENDEMQIRQEMECKGLGITEIDRYLDNWEDCQKNFGEKMNSPKTYRLSEALIIADIDYEEGAHDALVDAYNTALLFAKMKREPKLKLISYYMTEDDALDNYSDGLLHKYRHAG